MTEISYYWDGTILGDAIGNSPYTPSVFHSLWKKLFTRLDDAGIVEDFNNELLVEGIGGGVTVDTGAALVNGWYYENTSKLTIAISTPSSDPRIDRIVLQRDLANQTVRAVQLEGTENASPSAPTLTQDNAGIWEISIGQVLITTAGVITVSFDRVASGIDGRRISTPLVAQSDMSLIETKVAVGGETSFDFTSIPQTFENIFFVGQVRGSLSNSFFTVNINGDTNSANYGRQLLSISSGSPIASAVDNFLPFIGLTDNSADIDDAANQFDLHIANYTDTTFFKMITQKEAEMQKLATPFTLGVLSLEGNFWQNTDAINRVLFAVDIGTLVARSTVSLYGI